jgi:hypothetical protein
LIQLRTLRTLASLPDYFSKYRSLCSLVSQHDSSEILYCSFLVSFKRSSATIHWLRGSVYFHRCVVSRVSCTCGAEFSKTLVQKSLDNFPRTITHSESTGSSFNSLLRSQHDAGTYTTPTMMAHRRSDQQRWLPLIAADGSFSPKALLLLRNLLPLQKAGMGLSLGHTS